MSMTSAAAWSISKHDRFTVTPQLKKDLSMEKIGPNSYEVKTGYNSKLKGSAKYSIGQRFVEKDKQVGPSPGDYAPSSLNLPHAPGKTIGQRFMDQSQGKKNMAPGPGAYSQQKLQSHNYSFSMGQKVLDQENKSTVKMTPGPGAYNNDTSSKLLISSSQAKLGKIGNEKRSSMANEALAKFPGPGQHEPDFNYFKNKGPNYSIGTEKTGWQTQTDRKKISPGPGNYALPTMMGSGIKSSISCKFAVNPEEKEQQMKPGPGNYDGELIKLKKTAAKYTIGGSPRFDAAKEKMQQFQVSPNKYNPGTSSILKQASQYSFAKDSRKDLVNRDQPNFPSAASYQIPQRMSKDTPSYTMGGLFMKESESKTKLKVPGPGQYDLSDIQIGKISSSKYSIGKSHDSRNQNQHTTSEKAPGPGQYTSSLSLKNSAPNYGFGTTKRDQKAHKTITPGPGNYGHRNFVGNEGSQSTMHSKISYKTIEHNAKEAPGPGAYTHSLKTLKQAPSFGIGTEKRGAGSVGKNALVAPGAGTYLPNITMVLPHASTWAFGTEKRSSPVDKRKKISPGPGAYDQKPKAFGDTRFAYGQRLKESASMTAVPGSGSYDPKSILKSLPAYSMAAKFEGKGKGSQILIPGPGAYEHKLLNLKSGPQYGFGTDSREEKVARKVSVPGPGSYKLKATIGDVPDYSMPNRDEKSKYV